MPEHAYDKIYLGDIKTGQACLFEHVVYSFPHVNIEQFIRDYMHSRIRKLLDIAWPKYATNPSHDLLQDFMEETNYVMVIDKCHMDCEMAYWIGNFYAYYQWYWNIPSAKLVEWWPPEDLGVRYPGLHDKDASLIVEEWPPEELPFYQN